RTFCRNCRWSVLTYARSSYVYTLSLHDALPICAIKDQGLVAVRRRWVSASVELDRLAQRRPRQRGAFDPRRVLLDALQGVQLFLDRKSTRLNSSHVKISYAVFC